MKSESGTTSRLSSVMFSTNSGKSPRTATRSPAASRAEVTVASAKRITECVEVLLCCLRRAACPPREKLRLRAEESGGLETLTDARPEPLLGGSVQKHPEPAALSGRLPEDEVRTEARR